MNYKLREYQRRWCRKTYNAFTQGIEGGKKPTRILSTAATGAGKTVMASAFIWTAIKRHDFRTLFLADTDDLVDQARRGILNATGLVPSIEQGTNEGNRQSMNVVGSIQSISQPKRLESWPADHFGLVIADEAHLSMADTWQRTLKRFNGGGAWILGVTATPERGDEKDLWDFYEHLGDEVGLFELIDGGHLAPITVETVPLKIDATEATIQATYADGENDMARAIEPYWKQIIEEWKTRASDRKTLIFHPGISASQAFTKLLIEAGVSARHIDGNTTNRAELLEQFARGDFQVLNNAQLLQKGYDCPTIGCILILKPTQSRVAYQQMAGRGTRKAEGKSDCLLLDFFWEFAERMKPCGPADLMTREPAQRDEVARMLREGGTLDLNGALSEATIAAEDRIIERLRELAGKRQGLRFDARELGQLLHQPELANYVPTANWEKDPATEKQKAYLAKKGVTHGKIGKGEAARLIEFFNKRHDSGLATAKQVAFLATKGIVGHALTFAEASEAIDSVMGKTPA